MAYSRSTARIHVKTNTRARRVNHARLAHDVMEMAGESTALPLASCLVGCGSPNVPAMPSCPPSDVRGITLRREDSQHPPTPGARVNDDRKIENESESASFHGDILRRKGRSPTSDRANNPLHRVIRPVTGRKSMEEA
ncbi:hypothetical protein ABH945_001173 [Paraburkholderia sp. GAS333]